MPQKNQSRLHGRPGAGLLDFAGKLKDRVADTISPPPSSGRARGRKTATQKAAKDAESGGAYTTLSRDEWEDESDQLAAPPVPAAPTTTAPSPLPAKTGSTAVQPETDEDKEEDEATTGETGISPALAAHPVSEPADYLRVPDADADIDAMPPEKLVRHAENLENEWATTRQELEIARAKGEDYSACHTLLLRLQKLENRIDLCTGAFKRYIVDRELAAQERLNSAQADLDEVTKRLGALQKGTARGKGTKDTPDEFREIEQDELSEIRRRRREAVREARNLVASVRLETQQELDRFLRDRLASTRRALATVQTVLSTNLGRDARIRTAAIANEIKRLDIERERQILTSAERRREVIYTLASWAQQEELALKAKLGKSEGERDADSIEGEIAISHQARLGVIRTFLDTFERSLEYLGLEVSMAHNKLEETEYLLNASDAADRLDFEAAQEWLAQAAERREKAEREHKRLAQLTNPLATPDAIHPKAKGAASLPRLLHRGSGSH